MDLCLSDNMFDSFVKYQRLMNARFLELSKEHKFEVVDANRRVGLVQADLRAKLAAHLGIAP
jgi:dTMP kinase